MTFLYYSTYVDGSYVDGSYVVKFKKKGYIMSKKLDEVPNNEVRVDLQKREFMSKFGKYAAVSVGMAALMTPNASASFNSGSCERKQRSRRCGGSAS